MKSVAAFTAELAGGCGVDGLEVTAVVEAARPQLAREVTLHTDHPRPRPRLEDRHARHRVHKTLPVREDLRTPPS